MNLALDERRSRQRAPWLTSVTAWSEATERAAPARSPEAGFDLDRALRALPVRARAVFVLHDIEGHGHEEIATLMGVDPGTSKSQLHRARKLLREALELMTCEQTEQTIDDLESLMDGDGRLPEDRARALHSHLHVCPACRDQHDRAVVLASATRTLPRERAPVRDLWPEIAARIARSSAASTTAARGPAPRRSPVFSAVLIPAAAVLLLAGVAVGYRWARSPASLTVAPVSHPGPKGRLDVRRDRAAPAPLPPPLEQQHYEQALASLRLTLQARRDQLSPATVEIVERNLAVIDGAVLEIRQALQADPDNRQLAQLLSATEQQRIALLHRVLDLVERS